MYFKGTLIITDPCYIISDEPKEMSEEYKNQMPKREDFISTPTGDVREYPDVKQKTVDELNKNERDMVESFLKLKNVLKNSSEGCKTISEATDDILKLFLPYYSKKREEEFKAFNEAYDKWEEPYLSDWEKTYCGEELEILGINNYLVSRTYYGDWSCTTVKVDDNGRPVGKLGNFCADAGMVLVSTVEEIQKHYPNFNPIADHSITVIPDFEGEVELVLVKDKDSVKELYVRGKGNINFRTMQTGF